MKTIKIGAKTIELAQHASTAPVTGGQRHEAGRDAEGNLYYKGRTGRWSAAYQTHTEADRILRRAACRTISDAELELARAIQSLPKVVEGEVGSIDGWSVPTFDGDGRFWVHAQRDGINPRELARMGGIWFVRWPGFSWRRADANYM